MHPAFRKDSWLRGVFDLSSSILGDPALLVCAYCKPVRYLLPLYEHQWVDAQDGNGDWYEAQIRTVGDGCALVHYKGFKSHQDELHSWPYNRLAVLHSYTDSPLLEDEEDPGGDNVEAATYGALGTKGTVGLASMAIEQGAYRSVGLVGQLDRGIHHRKDEDARRTHGARPL